MTNQDGELEHVLYSHLEDIARALLLHHGDPPRSWSSQHDQPWGWTRHFVTLGQTHTRGSTPLLGEPKKKRRRILADEVLANMWVYIYMRFHGANMVWLFMADRRVVGLKRDRWAEEWLALAVRTIFLFIPATVKSLAAKSPVVKRYNKLLPSWMQTMVVYHTPNFKWPPLLPFGRPPTWSEQVQMKEC